MDFTLTEEQVMLRDGVRRFVQEEIVPVRAELDAAPDPHDGFSRELLRKSDAIGLRRMTLTEEDGGVDADVLTRCIVGEELGVGDLGFAICLLQAWRIAGSIRRMCNAEQQARFLPVFRDDPEAALSIGITEATGGSNWILGIQRDDSTLQTRAELRDGEWVLNGTKLFITNAGFAKLYMIIAATDWDKPLAQRFSTFIVPHDAPGLSTPRVENKMGQRLVWHGTIVMDDCRIPEENMVGERGGGMSGVEGFLAGEGGTLQVAAMALGTARAAYEAAVEFTRDRFIGGKPEIQHQLVHHRLASMRMRMDAARLYLYRAAVNVDNPDEALDPTMTALSKVFTSQVAFDVCKEALELFGGYGYMKDLPMEKYLRDVTGFLHEDGVNDVLLVQAARQFYDLPEELFR